MYLLLSFMYQRLSTWNTFPLFVTIVICLQLTQMIIKCYYITCTKILVLWLVKSRSLFWVIIMFIESGDKASYCTPFGSARVQNGLLLHSSFIFIESSVVHYFQYNLRTFCSKTRLFRKNTCETLREANATGAVRAFSVTQASA